MKPDKKYLKRCTLCGAEIYSDSMSRSCYKCDHQMVIKKELGVKNVSK